jgi:hypothetical protein
MTLSEAVEKLTPLLTEYAVQLKATEDKIKLLFVGYIQKKAYLIEKGIS